MSVQNNTSGSESVVLERPAAGGVYASLFEKINLSPVSELSALDLWQDAQAMSDATADERLTAGMQVFLECLTKAGAKVEKLDKSLIDHHIAELDYQISRQLDAVMHHDEFQAVESLWRGVKSLVDKTDFRQNVKIELLSMSKEDLRQDFEDSPEIIQSGLYKHTYIDEYDTPGGEPIAALISAYEFDASAQDVALLRNISKVSAAAHMPFTAGKFPLAALAAGITLMLAGCGLSQKVTDGTVAVTKSIFYKQIKALHLDIRAREAVNSNAGGVALSTVVRIYQLKDRKTFDSTDYPSLFKEDSQVIKADLLVEKDILLQPGGAVTVDMPMEENAQYVAVAGMFMSPDQENNTWRVVMSRDDLDPDKARVIEAGNNQLTMQALKDE